MNLSSVTLENILLYFQRTDYLHMVRIIGGKVHSDGDAVCVEPTYVSCDCIASLLIV